eukprot:762512-Hanusia_phi.AAC.1
MAWEGRGKEAMMRNSANTISPVHLLILLLLVYTNETQAYQYASTFKIATTPFLSSSSSTPLPESSSSSTAFYTDQTTSMHQEPNVTKYHTAMLSNDGTVSQTTAATSTIFESSSSSTSIQIPSTVQTSAESIISTSPVESSSSSTPEASQEPETSPV